jgi:hypothetical protein
MNIVVYGANIAALGGLILVSWIEGIRSIEIVPRNNSILWG